MTFTHAVDWNTVGLGIVAVINVVTAILSNRNHRLVRRVHEELKDTKENVVLIEKATNSMKDALVKTTAEAASAVGELKGRADARRESTSSSK